MMRFILAVMGGFAVAVSSAAQGAPPQSTGPSGVYSSVRYVEEAGDDLGMEVEVITKPHAAAVVTICEGQCSGGRTWPAVITGHTISFSVVEKLTDQDGNPAKTLTLKFVGQLKGDVLVMHMLDAPDVPDERLKRVANPTPGQTARLGCNATAC
jgi:hypothetical protein